MRLTDSVALAGRTAPSRVIFGPHETNLARERAISDRHVAYYQRRAAGGAGVIVTEIASVLPDDWPYERAPLAADSGPGWAAVVAACRPALVIAGLGHAGSQGSSAYSQSVLWGPSRVADVVSREMPMEMEKAEISALVRGFADAAALAVEAGVDGVEINAGQHSLLRQFLSGLTNQRGDEWGQNKAKLLLSVISVVREAVGDRIVGVRLGADELAPWAGITPDLSEETVLAIDADYLVPVTGSAMSVSATRPDLHTEPGFNLDLCRRLRTGSTLLVLQGSVVDAGQAQAALDDGAADLVEMTRAQIADPDVVLHVRNGSVARPCVLSNQRCQVRDNRNPIVTCVVEPHSGHELTEVLPDPPLEHGRVLVVGGGPAGMEAARLLATWGQQVRLVERKARLGGALRLAARVHGRLATFADWQESELERLGVEVVTGTVVSELDGEERVLVATGAKAAPPSYAVETGAVVLTAAELLSADEFPDGPVVVYDPIGGPIGVGVAELLAARGRGTAIVTQDQVAGTLLAITGDLANANTRLQQAGVRRVLSSRLRIAGDGFAVLENTFTGEQRKVACAALIDCGYLVPDETFVGGRPGLVRAGDCVAPRTVHEAVLEGRRGAALLMARIPAGRFG
jgi:2,4-dienoyl-CoA reductase (NADPH2)